MVTKRIARNEVVRIPLDSDFVRSKEQMLVRSRDLELTLQDAVRPEQLRLGRRWGRPRSCLRFALGGPSVVGGGISEFISEPHVVARPVWKSVDGGR
jgi:hypothetical protein